MQADLLARAAAHPVGRLATVKPDGSPHIVPITFAIYEDRVVTMIDHKPKKTYSLKRLSNIKAKPEVSVLVDHYDDDWSTLWWVRFDGPATVSSSGEEWELARDRLAAKYRQYRTRPPEGPAITVRIQSVSEWTA